MADEGPLGDEADMWGISGEYVETNYEQWKGAIGIIDGMYMCSGTLIDPEVVLTAGHCINMGSGNARVMGGANMNIHLADVAEQEAHETQMSDIGVIKLSEPVTDIECYGIRSENPTVGEEGWIVGYGITSADANDAMVHRAGETAILTVLGNFLQLGGAAGACNGDFPPCTRPGGPCLMNCNNKWNYYSFHEGGCHFLFADGSVQFLSENINGATLISLRCRFVA